MGAALLSTAVGFILMYAPFDDNQVSAYPMDQRGDHSYGMMGPGHYAAGSVASIQNDENGDPSWILSGYWKASLTEDETAENGNQSSSASNSTSNMGKDMSKNGKFVASFDMVRTNGSALHQHQIDNFTLTEMSMPDNNTAVFNGTLTVTMRDGPVTSVPTSVTDMGNNVVSIYLDPTAVDNHFGDTPIYGTITKSVQIIK
ncbi:MAG TPA: hypothetical protein VFG77_02735 [Nitrososphaeraceae archaeon]|jgi:hypothetical protein|nr:hypothetical protein [Nitrososphaeraceae archaeon]